MVWADTWVGYSKMSMLFYIGRKKAKIDVETFGGML